MIPDDLLPDDVLNDAAALLAACREQGVRIATAESCTGGLIAATLTEIAGASDVLERGFVTYSNDAKQEMLGVPAEMLRAVGAVSEEVARAMAAGALAHARADIAVAVTGIVGPGGGSLAKPVGMVCFGITRRGAPPRSERQLFQGDRARIRIQAVARALTLIRDQL